jgi:hypothetical protein
LACTIRSISALKLYAAYRSTAGTAIPLVFEFPSVSPITLCSSSV